MVDIDFDGTISKKDLKQFLAKLPSIETKEITDPKIDRLFKLLDRYKRGHIQADDFLHIFSENPIDFYLNPNFSQQRSATVSPTSPFSGSIFQNMPSNKQEFDWKKNAKQQLGLILSKQYTDLRAGFDSIQYIIFLS